MATKSAGMGVAFVVIALVLGLISIIGVILLMMWFQPGIEHSPSERAPLSDSRVIVLAQVSHLSMLAGDFSPRCGA